VGFLLIYTEAKMSVRQNPKNIVNDAIIKDIASAVGSLEYGSVMIKVHDKKIIQIEVAEKKRFDDVWRLEGGGGI
jgi:hypothetical protein